jgi:hypothetical protein
MTTSTHTYTDMNDIVESILTPEIQINVCNSVVWRAGTLIVTEVQRLLREIKEAHASDPDMTPELLASLIREDEFLAECLTEAGMSSTARVQRIADLYLFRNEMIEAGQQAASLAIGWDGNPREFRFSTIDEELEKPISTSVGELVQRRISMDVERSVKKGKLDEAKAEKRIADRLERAKEDRKRMAEAVAAQRDAVIKLWGTCEMHIEREGTCQPFAQMDADLQHALLTSALQGAERAKQYAMDDRRMTDGMYDAFLDDFDRVEDLLNDMLRTRRV